MATQKVMGAKEWALLLALSVLWGGSYFFIGVAVKELPPLTLMMLRVAIAALILHVIVRAMGQWMPRDPKVWLAFAGMGLLNNAIPQSLIVWGQTQIPSGLASILNATTPLFGVVVAHFFTSDEKMTGKKLIGVIVGFIGAAVMVGPEALQGLGTNVWAQVAILLASAFYGISGVYGRRFKQMGVTPMMTATGQLTASTLMLTPVALLVDQSWTLTHPSLAAWAAIANGARLFDLLPHSCLIGCDQPVAGHVSDPGQCGASGLPVSWRAIGTEEFRRHGAYRAGPGSYRRAAAELAQA
jgi:drug/metabolite transporter (DMT)-like permease